MARSYPGVDWVSLRDPIIRHLGRAAMVIALLRGPRFPSLSLSAHCYFLFRACYFPRISSFCARFRSFLHLGPPRLQGFTGRGASVRLETAGAIVARRTQGVVQRRGSINGNLAKRTQEAL